MSWGLRLKSQFDITTTIISKMWCCVIKKMKGGCHEI